MEFSLCKFDCENKWQITYWILSNTEFDKIQNSDPFLTFLTSFFIV